MAKIRVTQKDRVLRHLYTNGSITSWEAIKEYGITRLSAIIYNLRQEHIIVSKTEVAKNRHGDCIHYVKYILDEKYDDVKDIWMGDDK